MSSNASTRQTNFLAQGRILSPKPVLLPKMLQSLGGTAHRTELLCAEAKPSSRPWSHELGRSRSCKGLTAQRGSHGSGAASTASAWRQRKTSSENEIKADDRKTLNKSSAKDFPDGDWRLFEDQVRPYFPIISACARICSFMARSTSAFVAPAFKFSFAFSAYSLKKYRCGLPGGGHGPPYPILPKSLRPCRAPFASCSCFATPSASSRVSAGRSNSTQCTHVPAGASGSSIISAKLCVFAGGSVQLSFGETSGPSHANFFGIISPAENDALDIFMVPPWICAGGVAPRKEARHNERQITPVVAKRIGQPVAIFPQSQVTGGQKSRESQAA